MSSKKITKKQMQKITKYMPIKFIKDFLISGFIDLTNIESIKSLPNDIIEDNWIELNYFYNKALVEGDLETVEVLNKVLTVKS